jgi:hypothetical protein
MAEICNELTTLEEAAQCNNRRWGETPVEPSAHEMGRNPPSYDARKRAVFLVSSLATADQDFRTVARVGIKLSVIGAGPNVWTT